MKHILTFFLLLSIAVAELQAGIFTSKSTPVCEPICEYETLKKGVLTIGMNFDNPPFSYIANGKKTGFEVDLMNAISKRLKIQSRFVETHWNDMIAGLENHHYDAIIGAMTITKKREEKISFSNPYLTTTLSVIINPMINPEIRNFSNLRGRVVAVQEGTTDYSALKGMLKRQEAGSSIAYSYNQVDEIALKVQKGEIDTMLMDLPIAEYIVDKYPGLRIAFQIPENSQPLAIGFNKHSGSLKAAINQVLNGMIEDGSFEVIYHKWFIK